MKRVHAIDFLRGLVMLIMAIDHTRDFLHVTSATLDPTDLSTTTVGLFLTRWITHLCAPTFVFLSGTSAYFSVKSQQNLSKSRRFLLTRGIWLIGLEFTLINFALWFDVHFRTFMFQVIAAIGFGFIILSLLLRVKPTILSVVGLGIIALHNLIPRFGVGDSWLPKLLTAIWLRPDFISTGADVNIIVSYPIWQAMVLGHCGRYRKLVVGSFSGKSARGLWCYLWACGGSISTATQPPGRASKARCSRFCLLSTSPSIRRRCCTHSSRWVYPYSC